MAKVRKTGTKRNSKAKLENGLDRGLILTGFLVAQRAQDKAPIDTGRLKRSITPGRPYSTANGRAIDIGTNVEYAAIQEYGGEIPPHVIEPRNKQALAFPGAGGEQVVVKRVNHPGATIPAQPYLRPALRDVMQGPNREGVVILVRSIVGALISP